MWCCTDNQGIIDYNIQFITPQSKLHIKPELFSLKLHKIKEDNSLLIVLNVCCRCCEYCSIVYKVKQREWNKESQLQLVADYHSIHHILQKHGAISQRPLLCISVSKTHSIRLFNKNRNIVCRIPIYQILKLSLILTQLVTNCIITKIYAHSTFSNKVKSLQFNYSFSSM